MPGFNDGIFNEGGAGFWYWIIAAVIGAVIMVGLWAVPVEEVEYDET